MSSLLSSVFGLIVMLLVPAVVWTTVAAGLYQLVREEAHHVRIAPQRSQRLERYSHQTS